MRLRQSPMSEASALMGITLILFIIGLFIITGDINKALGKGSLLSALLLFPAFVIWAIFARLAREAKVFTRFLVATAVTMGISAAGAFLLQPGDAVSGANQLKAIQEIAKIVIAFAASGLIASGLVYGLLIRDRPSDNSTLLTAPVIRNTKKKKRK